MNTMSSIPCLPEVPNGARPGHWNWLRLWVWIGAWAVGAGGLDGLPSAGAARPESRPNVIFILADDLGVHDLGCYGRADHRTPHLDRLAGQGTRFSSAYCAQPICSPSRAAILSGHTPARLGLTTYLPGRADAPSQRVLHPPIEPQLPLAEVTLAERFAEAGYATACLGKWHVGGAGFGPAQQGFQVVHTGKANTVPGPDEGGKGEYDLTRQAEAFLEANRDRPFFLYLAHNSPHIPYTAREETVRRNAGAFEPVYAAVIESLDDTVGRLMARLDALGLAERTVVIFTSDNGGLHVPEGGHSRVTHNGRFRAGKGFLYEGGLRIPLIVRWPGRVPAGRIVDAPVINTDWTPTLADLAGLEPVRGTDGTSFARPLTGRGGWGDRRFYWHFPHYTNQGGRPGGAVREGRWKYLEFYDTGERELYQLETDPGETRNLAAAEPRRVARMGRDLAAWRESVGARLNRPNPECDDARFRALYVDFDPSRFDPPAADAAAWERVAAWRRGMDAALRDR